MKLLIIAVSIFLFHCVLSVEISNEDLGCHFKRKFLKNGLIHDNNFRLKKMSNLKSVQKVLKQCSGNIRTDCLYFYNVTSCVREYLYPTQNIYAWKSELVRSQWVCSKRFHPKNLKEVKTRKEIEVFGQYGSCVFRELGVYDNIFDEFKEDNFPSGHESKFINLYIEILKECKMSLGYTYNFQFFYDLLKCADLSKALKYF